MKTFKLSSKITISVYTEVEAETLEEAIEIASDREVMEVISDSFYTEESFWVATELDGTPYDIKEAV